MLRTLIRKVRRGEMGGVGVQASLNRKSVTGQTRQGQVEAEVTASASMSEFVPYVFAGMAFAAAVAFAGAYIGENAVASTAPGTASLNWQQQPLTTASTDSPEATSPGLVFASLMRTTTPEEDGVVTTGALRGSFLSQADLASLNASEAAEGQAIAEDGKSDGLFGMAEINSGDDGQQLASATPPLWKLEQTFAAGAVEKRRRVAERRFQLTEQTCLARAVYFEARSETELGQQAVARVVLNRVQDPSYPKTICGVVYQGADRPNQCQFSFACDGESDDPKNRSQWKQAQTIATRAMAGTDGTASIMGAATHYHADYVRPKWSYSLRRLIKIGRHIFYADS